MEWRENEVMLIPVKIPSRVELTKKLEIVNLDENDAHTLGLIINSFLFPVIALSGVKSWAGHGSS